LRRKRSSLGRKIRRTLLLIILGAGMVFLGYQLFLYQQARATFPTGTTIAGMNVSGLTPDEAEALLRDRYMSPVVINHRSERLELDPAEVGFNLEVEEMLSQAQEAYAAQNYWVGFLYHLLGWSWDPIKVPLQAGYDPALLKEMIETMAGFLDKPGSPPQILSETGVFKPGEGGYVTDVDASLSQVERALYSSSQRTVDLVIVEEDAPALDFELLQAVIRSKLSAFDGMGSVFIVDLQTGEEIRINSDVAMSGLSILKIGVFIEAFRHMELPLTDYQEQLLLDTATRSSNYGANLLLHVIAGEDNTYEGAELFTNSMWNLGLENTFMAVPYDAPVAPNRPSTYTTPANSRTDVTTFPDPNMQTTAEDIGSLLAMLYYCSEGGGTLLAVYPQELTPEECQRIIDLMALNEEGNLIRFGVPNEATVSHKHGWAQGTHADAGIVLSPGGDYVLVEYLHQNGSWLQSSVSFPVLREIARAVYNYFNYDDPYLGDALAEEERFEEASSPEEGQLPEEGSAPAEGAAPEDGAEPQAEATPTPTATPTQTTSNQ
jgi:beta-lactamase class A